MCSRYRHQGRAPCREGRQNRHLGHLRLRQSAGGNRHQGHPAHLGRTHLIQADLQAQLGGLHPLLLVGRMGGLHQKMREPPERMAALLLLEPAVPQGLVQRARVQHPERKAWLRG